MHSLKKLFSWQIYCKHNELKYEMNISQQKYIQILNSDQFLYQWPN